MTEPAVTLLWSATIGKLAAALAKAQASFGPIERNRTVKTGTYNFDYAPLDTILEAVRPALAANELALTQVIVPSTAGMGLRTLLLHSSGEWLAGEVSLGQRPAKAQELGSLLTYMRRYSIVSILGVAAEEDDDANAADGNAATVAGRKLRPVQAKAAKLDATPASLTEAEQNAAAVVDAELADCHTPEELATWKAGPGEAAKAGAPAFVAVVQAKYKEAYRRIHGAQKAGG